MISFLPIISRIIPRLRRKRKVSNLSTSSRVPSSATRVKRERASATRPASPNARPFKLIATRSSHIIIKKDIIPSG